MVEYVQGVLEPIPQVGAGERARRLAVPRVVKADVCYAGQVVSDKGLEGELFGAGTLKCMAVGSSRSHVWWMQQGLRSEVTPMALLLSRAAVLVQSMLESYKCMTS